jgi:2-dehydropantoate 2-reductase
MQEDRSVKNQTVTIVGAGAIGGLAGAYMVKGGVDVVFVDINADHVQAMQEKGLTVRGLRGEFTVEVCALTPDELEGPLGAVALACKSQHTPAAVESLAPHLGSDGFVLSLQNGFNEEVIAEMIGEERVVGGLPDYGGAYLEPGLLEHTSVAPLYIGELDGTRTQRVEFLADALSLAFPVEITDDIVARLWAKAVYGLQIPLSALVNARTREVRRHKHYKPLAVMLVGEGIEAADASGINLPSGKYFDADLYRVKTAEGVKRVFDFIERATDLLAKHKDDSEKAGGYAYHKKASGVWWDIVVRERKSEVRWLDGTLIEKAKRVGVEMPLAERLCEMIYEIEEGDREMGWENLDELRDYADHLGYLLPGM